MSETFFSQRALKRELGIQKALGQSKGTWALKALHLADFVNSFVKFLTNRNYRKMAPVYFIHSSSVPVIVGSAKEEFSLVTIAHSLITENSFSFILYPL